MSEILLIGFLVFVFIVIPIGIGLLLYFIPKRMGYPKVSKYLTVSYGVIVFLIILLVAFEDQLFSKIDAKELVEEQGIELVDEFELINNESMSSIGDYYHTFTLRISGTDKMKIINTIKKSDNFKKIGEPILDLYFDTENIYKGTKRTQNYETEDSFVREYMKPNGDGSAPTYRRIKIYKQKDELIFEDIDY
ncbi:hypothetical protein [Aquimarina algicola]|uniref:Uncharacterized protein n=1 Tax=Aquimarina algicola TaxID=2589995 RepID=A0A504J8F1_9FLAO|nr:hypothetical protein [Aquimarina algicola]TPN86854.1 hypothetical protein FHK87_04425 [Aquimarina algicola]